MDEEDAAEGQDVAEGQDAAKGQDAAEGHDAAEGQVAAKGQETLNNQLKIGIGVIHHRNCLVALYSLTKYSAIFAEVKGYFGITAPDNQLGRRSLCSLRIKSRYQLNNQLKIGESVVDNRHINQLKDGERFDASFKCQRNN